MTLPVPIPMAIAMYFTTWWIVLFAILPNRTQLIFLRAEFFIECFRCNCSTGTVTRYLFLTKISQGGAVLFAPPRKAIAFLTTRSVCQKYGTGNFAACGQRSGLLALNLGSIFEKLLHRKTFWFVQRLSENHAIRKNGLPHPAKGGSTPAFACQRAAIAPLPCLNLQP